MVTVWGILLLWPTASLNSSSDCICTGTLHIRAVMWFQPAGIPLEQILLSIIGAEACSL